MATMNISLPDALKAFVDEQVSGQGYGTRGDYVRDLIRMDQGRRHLRSLLLDGMGSPPGAEAGASYFDGLRNRVLGANTTSTTS